MAYKICAIIRLNILLIFFSVFPPFPIMTYPPHRAAMVQGNMHMMGPGPGYVPVPGMPMQGGYGLGGMMPQSTFYGAPRPIRHHGIRPPRERPPPSTNPIVAAGLNQPRSLYPKPNGPPVTVFVGNITERAPDIMMRQLLNACGNTLSWKRVQGANGKLQAFGFCEFGNPDAALKAIRLLHDNEVGEKKLVVKVDSKTKHVLDDYKQECVKKNGKPTPKDPQNIQPLEYMDELMTKEDELTQEKLDEIGKEFRHAIESYVAEDQKDLKKGLGGRQDLVPPALRPGGVLAPYKPTRPPNEGERNILEEEELEEGKKELILTEIGRFREQHLKEVESKKAAAAKDDPPGIPEREPKSEKISHSRKLSRPPSPSPPPRSKRRRTRSPTSRDRDRRDDDRRRDREDRDRDRRRPDRDRDHRRDRDRRRDEEPHGRSQERSNERFTSAERDAHRARSQREKEIEDEEKERKKLDRKAREKEAQYQELVRKWEQRERQKTKEYDRDKKRERDRTDEMEVEAKRLKNFLQDYDDERDDGKYYRGREFSRRLQERKLEEEADDKDRQREKDELDELKRRLMDEGHDDPMAVFDKICAQREEKFQPVLLVQPDPPPMVRQSLLENLRTASPQMEQMEKPVPNYRGGGGPKVKHSPEKVSEPAGWEFPGTGSGEFRSGGWTTTVLPSPPVAKSSPQGLQFQQPQESPPEIMDTGDLGADGDMQSPRSRSPGASAGGKKKLSIRDVFNPTGDDEEEKEKQRKRKLPPPSEPPNQKKKHIQSIIDKIPTAKDELFAFPLDLSNIDQNLMEKRIRPWINKKIVEYIGEEEKTLLDFICQKIEHGIQPAALINDVKMVLDDEAEIFVVKMWRLLIYEIENRKLALLKYDEEQGSK